MKTIRRKSTKSFKPPRAGDVIYVPSRTGVWLNDRNINGGRAVVSKVYKMAGLPLTVFVNVYNLEGESFNWTDIVGPAQAELKRTFGDQRACFVGSEQLSAPEAKALLQKKLKKIQASLKVTDFGTYDQSRFDCLRHLASDVETMRSIVFGLINGQVTRHDVETKYG